MKCINAINDENVYGYAYVHFHSDSGSYFTSEKLLGAAGWKSKEEATNFIISIGLKIEDFVLEEFVPSSSTKIIHA